MRKILFLLASLLMLSFPVAALDLEAPRVPCQYSVFMPSEPENLGEGLMEILRDGLLYLRPDLREAAASCLSVGVVMLLVSLVQNFPGLSQRYMDLGAMGAISLILFQGTNSMIHLGVDTVGEISAYGKLLLPVLATAMAAQGGVTASAGLYGATALFSSLFSGMISSLLTPLIYCYLCLGAAKGVNDSELLKRFQDGMKSLMTWALKTILYVYTGYMAVTGVISGTTDAAALKTAKLTISSMIPVVGGILSDASETILVSAATVKNAAGIYGLWAIVAIFLGPMLKIGVHDLLLKAMATFSTIFAGKKISGLVDSFSGAMGHIFAMTGAVCLMLLVSVVCFMKGVG